MRCSLLLLAAVPAGAFAPAASRSMTRAATRTEAPTMMLRGMGSRFNNKMQTVVAPARASVALRSTATGTEKKGGTRRRCVKFVLSHPT